MRQKLWDEAEVFPRREVWSKGHPVVNFESLHRDHERSEKLQSQYQYIDSGNPFQDVPDLDLYRGYLYLVPGLEYVVQNLVLMFDEHDLLLSHRRKVEIQVELDKR